MGLVPQGGQHRARGGQEVVLPGGGGELAQARPQDEPSLGVACHQAVELQCHCDAVGGGAGQVGGRDELGQGGRARLQGVHDQGGLVDDADAAAVFRVVHGLTPCVHNLILASQGMRFQLDSASDSRICANAETGCPMVSWCDCLRCRYAGSPGKYVTDH